MLQLLTDRQRINLQQWKYSVDDPSITTQLLSGFWNTVVEWVPEYVSANVLSLSGLMMILFSYHLTSKYFAMAPRLISLLSAVLIFVYQTLDAIDGKHARRTKNASPLGELFDHACDSIGTMFLILTIAIVLGINNPTTLFYVTQSGMLLFLMEHLTAFRTRKVEFARYAGPGELLLGCIALLLWRFFTGYSFIPQVVLESYLFPLALWIVYAGVFMYCVAVVSIDIHNKAVWTYITKEPWPIGSKLMALFSTSPHFGTRIGLLFCLFMRAFNAILLYLGWVDNWSYQDVIAHGLVMSVIISDMIVAKMASRELHPTIVLGSMFTVFNYNIVTFVLVASYFTRMFYEICESMNLMLFTPAKNVYICGVWDLLHFGHMRHFQEVTKLGNRVLVGVHSDKEVASYKRHPTLSMKERMDTAILCKGVSEVISNAPLAVTENFIRKHNIHVVGCSAEYDSPDDKYYAVPRKMGILKVIPRVDGISTSDLRRRTHASVELQKDSKKLE